MKCPNCNFENEADATVCLQCGKHLTQEVDEDSNFNAQNFSELPQNFEVPNEEDKIKLSEMKKNNKNKKAFKIIGIIVAVILVIAISLGIAYAISPRDVLQLFLSDKNYAELTIGENILNTYQTADKDNFILNQKYSKTYNTDVNINFTSNFIKKLPENPIFAESVVYLNSLNLERTNNVDGLVTKSDMILNDKNGEVLSSTIIRDKSIRNFDFFKYMINENEDNEKFLEPVYFKADKIYPEWLASSVTTLAPGDIQKIYNIANNMHNSKKQISKGSKNVIDEFFDVCFKKGLNDIESSKQLSVGAAVIDGDKLSFILTPKELKVATKQAIKVAKKDRNLFNGINEMYNAILKDDPDLAVRINSIGVKMNKEDYEKWWDDIFNFVTEPMDNMNWKNASISFYVNKENKIMGVKIKFVPKKDKDNKSKTNIISIVLPSEKNNMNFGFSNKEGDCDFRIEVNQKTKKSGTTMIYLNDKDTGILINAKGTYKNIKFDDGILDGQFFQNIDYIYVENGKQKTKKITASYKSKKYNNNQKTDTCIIIKIDKVGNFSINETITNNEFNKFNIPDRNSVIDLNSSQERNSDKLKEANKSLEKYIFLTLPKSRPEFANFLMIALDEDKNSKFEEFNSELFLERVLST